MFSPVIRCVLGTTAHAVDCASQSQKDICLHASDAKTMGLVITIRTISNITLVLRGKEAKTSALVALA